MKNQDIINCYKGLAEMRKAPMRRLPGRTCFTIIKNMKTLEPIVESIEAAYNEIVLKYADPVDGETNSFQVREGQKENLTQELNELYNIDTEVNLTKIQLSEIAKCDCSINEMEALYLMIEEDEEEQ